MTRVPTVWTSGLWVLSCVVACSSDADTNTGPGTGFAGTPATAGAGGAGGGGTGTAGGGDAGGTSTETGGAGAPAVGGGAGAAGMTAGSGGAAGTTAGAGSGAGTGGDAGTGTIPDEPFSFFVTSLRALQELSGNDQGFGGDLRYGETGEGAGLRGADKICTEIAERSMPGSGAKEWRAFLSAVAAGPGGSPVHAIDRIGEGPWYDRIGRLFANDKSELMGFRPTMTDPAIVNDFPNEDGVPNHDPDGTGAVDNHDTLTGSNALGQVFAMDMHVTCDDWTNAVPDSADAPRVGHSWPRNAGGGGGFPGFPGGGGPGGGDPTGGGYGHWISSLTEAGCGPGVFLIEMGGPMESNPTVGSGGGYGGFYCFARNP